MKPYLFAFLISSITVWAQPSGFESIEGGASYHIDANGAHIIQSGNQAIVHWDTFSLGKGEFAKFLQQDAQSAILNRVVGGSLSKIYGHIESNGKVFIINRAGVLIEPGATINCAGFLASTANISDEVFLNGKEMLFKEYGEGEIINLGTISSPTGDVLILAKHVENLGSIYAKSVFLAADTEVLLKPEGPVFIQPTFDTTLKTTDPYAIAMKMEGEVIAQKIDNQGGKIFLVADKGKTEVNGVLATSGGMIHVLGEDVAICDKAQIDVSSDHGAGEILIGGDLQGKNPQIKNSSQTIAHKGAEIHADSYNAGDGGKIILWSDGDTVCDATLSAKSYGTTGNGGFVEVSGKESIAISTHPDLSAENGSFGTFLMDAGSIIIDHSNSGGPSTYGDQFIITQLQSSNYMLDTGEGAYSLTIQNPATITWSEPTYLELIAGRNMIMQSGTTIQSDSTAGNQDAIRMTANASGAGNYIGINIEGTVQSASNDIRITGTGGDDAGSSQHGVSIVGGTVSATDAGNIIINGTGGPGAIGTGNIGVLILSNAKVSANSGIFP
ncbi:filamentous hemagglutinin N-terminal domain-containing protein [Simkania sp.]|uniref:two-partner secretion domain-containing protein n=1 Tax=Simkania sp. TaxID=34094 RepID=UPI003B52E8F8